MFEAPDAPEPPEAPDPPAAGAPPRTPRAPRAPRASTPEIHVWKDGHEIDPEELDSKIRSKLDGMHFEGLEGLGQLRDLDSPDGMRVFMNAGRGRLGVRIQTLNDDLASALGSTGTKGAFVTEVMDDTPAAKAGIKAGDVITQVGSTPIVDAAGLVKALAQRDGRVSLTVVRRGAKRTVDADLEATSSRTTGEREGPRIRREIVRIPEPGQGRRVYRMRTKDDGHNEDGDLQDQLRELRQELRELRQQIEEHRK